MNMKTAWLFGVLSVAALGAAAIRPAHAAPPGPPPAAPAAAAPPASPPRPARPIAKDDLDAELEAAQRQLEQAAHEVARLSTQLSGAMIQQVMPFAGPHVIIGVQLEAAAGNAGARVREVSPGGAAAEAGIRPGDVIVMLNGAEIKGEAPSRQVTSLLHGLKADNPVSVRVLRDGKPLDFAVTPRPGPGLFVDRHGMEDLDLEIPELTSVLVHRPLTDLELATLTPRLGSYFGSDKGVLVVRAPADGALKLEDGDVILAIDGRAPTSGSHATRILSSYQAGEKITLRIIRQHRTLDLETTLPERAPHRQTLRRETSFLAPAAHETRRVTITGNDET